MPYLCGVIAKLILNIMLVPIPKIGIYGAAIGSNVCHIFACVISYICLKKYINLKLSKQKYIIKPFLAVIIMTIFAKFTYAKLSIIYSQKISTIIAIGLGTVIYIVSIFGLKIFNKNEIESFPNGDKIFKKLKNAKIYK